MNYYDYLNLSLELHLFFDRIMKEHSLFLELAFTEKENQTRQIAKKFQQAFNKLLQKSVEIAHGNITNNVIASGEFITPNTLIAEQQMNKYFECFIDTNLTKEEQRLNPGRLDIDRKIISDVTYINKEGLSLLKNFIKYQEEVLEQVLTCKIYTNAYPSFINHMLEEARLYDELLTGLFNGQFISKNNLYEQEIFWNHFMKEHALFIRGLLDPSENDSILLADKFAQEYQMIDNRYKGDFS